MFILGSIKILWVLLIIANVLLLKELNGDWNLTAIFVVALLSCIFPINIIAFIILFFLNLIE